LFTTGYARNAIVHDGRLDPGVELLTKPFSQAALGEKLRDIIDAKSTPARVLLVEDETLIQMLAEEYLEEVGIKVDNSRHEFGAGPASGASNALYFTAGPADETHGLFGSLTLINVGSGTDYTATNSYLYIPAGQTSATVTWRRVISHSR
jgi:hypothetical protein